MSSQPPNTRYQALGDGDLTPEQLDGMDLWDRDVMLDERHRAIGSQLVRRAVAEIRRRRAEEQALNELAPEAPPVAESADLTTEELRGYSEDKHWPLRKVAQELLWRRAGERVSDNMPAEPDDLTTEELRGYSEDKHWPLREMAQELLWRRGNSGSSLEGPQPGERRDMIALRNTLASARAAKAERFTIGIEVAETASRLAWLTLERTSGATAAPGATVLRPDQSLPCKHARTERGKDAQRSWGTWRTQVCLDCGSFRTHAHDDAPDTSPGWTKSRWRPAAEYEEAVRDTAMGDEAGQG